jgi:hypothetical protein
VGNDNAYSQHDVESFGKVLHVLTLGLWVGFHVHAVKHLNGLTLIEACSASFGAEGWKKGGPRIPASDKVYDYMIFNIEDIEVVIRLQFLMSWLQVEEAIIGISKEWRSQCFLLWGWSMHLPSWWEQKFLVVIGFVVNMVWAALRGKVISTTTPPQLCQHPINSAIISTQVTCQMLVPFISLLIFFCLIKYAPKTRYH